VLLSSPAGIKGKMQDLAQPCNVCVFALHLCCMPCCRTVLCCAVLWFCPPGMKGKMQDLAKNLGLPNPAALTGGQM
jgi:hypothetical protein